MHEKCPPLIAAYHGMSPEFAGEPAFAGSGAAVLGRARLGRGLWLGARSVIRADGHHIHVGDDFHLGEGATVHIAHDVYPTHVGQNVTAGKGAVIHACTIGDNCVIERGAVILDGSEVADGVVVTAGSVVFPRSKLEAGWLYSGSPAQRVARVSASELASYHQQTRNDLSAGKAGPAGDGAGRGHVFVAPTATLAGRVTMEEGVGVWYGCRLEAGSHEIRIGEGTNVQDNSTILCETRDVEIGPDVTIGHNVLLVDCRVERASLVGIGSRIAAGTVIESDVLVAAGTETEPDQRLTGGKVWAGRPARPIADMTDARRGMLAATLPMYRDYATQFAGTSHQPMLQPGEE
ncbi:gamma carbonic anhydrase family protein [Cereibacter sphaeroides]|uniref:gamma carbonic anhydrase family protein n=1 Tax=Cereibacter sphaeroides TaxID=1063 RepID=UPI0011943E93|nr:gamma carbonic anhydrase family protein [Cereibacter sphaeroides]GEM94222.1 hypothetical protein RSP03_32890 [Cereibacter sphaeroides]